MRSSRGTENQERKPRRALRTGAAAALSADMPVLFLIGLTARHWAVTLLDVRECGSAQAIRKTILPAVARSPSPPSAFGLVYFAGTLEVVVSEGDQRRLGL
jgi:hypothetical protein